MDNLITSFMFHIRAILADATKHVDKALAEYNASLVVDLPKLARFKWFPNRAYIKTSALRGHWDPLFIQESLLFYYHKPVGHHLRII